MPHAYLRRRKTQPETALKQNPLDLTAKDTRTGSPDLSSCRYRVGHFQNGNIRANTFIETEAKTTVVSGALVPGDTSASNRERGG